MPAPEYNQVGIPSFNTNFSGINWTGMAPAWDNAIKGLQLSIESNADADLYRAIAGASTYDELINALNSEEGRKAWNNTSKEAKRDVLGQKEAMSRIGYTRANTEHVNELTKTQARTNAINEAFDKDPELFSTFQKMFANNQRGQAFKLIQNAIASGRIDPNVGAGVLHAYYNPDWGQREQQAAATRAHNEAARHSRAATGAIYQRQKDLETVAEGHKYFNQLGDIVSGGAPDATIKLALNNADMDKYLAAAARLNGGLSTYNLLKGFRADMPARLADTLTRQAPEIYRAAQKIGLPPEQIPDLYAHPEQYLTKYDAKTKKRIPVDQETREGIERILYNSNSGMLRAMMTDQIMKDTQGIEHGSRSFIPFDWEGYNKFDKNIKDKAYANQEQKYNEETEKRIREEQVASLPSTNPIISGQISSGASGIESSDQAFFNNLNSGIASPELKENLQNSQKFWDNAIVPKGSTVPYATAAVKDQTPIFNFSREYTYPSEKRIKEAKRISEEIQKDYPEIASKLEFDKKGNPSIKSVAEALNELSPTERTAILGKAVDVNKEFEKTQQQTKRVPDAYMYKALTSAQQTNLPASTTTTASTNTTAPNVSTPNIETPANNALAFAANNGRTTPTQYLGDIDPYTGQPFAQSTTENPNPTIPGISSSSSESPNSQMEKKIPEFNYNKTAAEIMDHLDDPGLVQEAIDELNAGNEERNRKLFENPHGITVEEMDKADALKKKGASRDTIVKEFFGEKDKLSITDSEGKTINIPVMYLESIISDVSKETGTSFAQAALAVSSHIKHDNWTWQDLAAIITPDSFTNVKNFLEKLGVRAKATNIDKNGAIKAAEWLIDPSTLRMQQMIHRRNKNHNKFIERLTPFSETGYSGRPRNRINDIDLYLASRNMFQY